MINRKNLILVVLCLMWLSACSHESVKSGSDLKAPKVDSTPFTKGWSAKISKSSERCYVPVANEKNWKPWVNAGAGCESLQDWTQLEKIGMGLAEMQPDAPWGA